MKPAPLDLTIYKGDTADVYFRVRTKNPDGSAGAYINLTGATPKAQIRATATSPTIIVEFTASLDDQTARPGGILLHLTAVQTAAFTSSTMYMGDPVEDGNYVWFGYYRCRKEKFIGQ